MVKHIDMLSGTLYIPFKHGGINGDLEPNDIKI